MDAFQVTNALSAAFFGLLGIWAAVVKRHWFLRLGVVGAFLLSALLIPAYEVVIEFGIQIALIAMAMRYYQHGLRLPRAFSMETALLAMTVLAVAAAFAAQMPDLGWQRWLKVIGVGVLTALAALLSLWFVDGRTRLLIRAMISLAGIAGLALLFFIGGALEYVEYVPFSVAGWTRQLQTYFTTSYFFVWIAWGLSSILLGLFVMVMMITLARASGWFATLRDPPTRRSSHILAARLALGALAIAVATPLLIVFHALLFPPPLPTVVLPSPNGFDDLVAAGKLAPADTFPRVRRWDSMSWTERRESYELVQPVATRIAIGVAKVCRVRDPFADRASAEYEEEMGALIDASMAMLLHFSYLESFGTTNEYINACLLDLEFGEQSIRGSGSEEWDGMSVSGNAHRLSRLLGDLSAEQCRDLSLALSHFDQTRESYEQKTAIQSHIDQHSDWETRLNYLLTEWSGFEHYSLDYWGRRHIAELRLLILHAALQAYYLENGRPPDDLDELAPRYLAQTPDDPLGDGQLKYRRNGDTYVIYCCGFDGDDDGGVEEDLSDAAGGDMVVRGPAMPSARKQLLDFGNDVYQRYLLPLAPTPPH